MASRIPAVPKSRLPVSGLTPRIPVSQAFEAPVMSHLVKPAVRRRSKSYTDLTNLSKMHTNHTANLKPTVSKPSTSSTRLNAISERPKNTAAQPTTRQPLKRGASGPSQSENEKPKAKVAKRIPDWDYKARFADLQTRHASLEKAHKATRAQLDDLENISEELGALKRERNDLIVKLKDSKQKCDNFEYRCKQLGDLKVKHEALTENYEMLLIQDRANIAKLDDLTKKHDSALIDLDKYKLALDALQAEKIERNNELDALKVKSAALESRCEQLEHLEQEHIVLTKEHNLVVSQYRKQGLDLCDITTRHEIALAELDKYQRECATMKSDVEAQEAMRRKMHNTIQDLKGNIRVFCRVRPPIGNEGREKTMCGFNFQDESSLEIKKPRESSVSGKNGDLKQEFEFDKVFPPESAHTEIFEDLAELIQSALDGYNVCVFAYGQTGSGKTHTMQGSAADPGMIPRTNELIFESIQQQARRNMQYTVQVSFLEIYNENIRDLLVPESTIPCEVRYNEGRGVTVTNLMTVEVTTALELGKLMKEAHRNRATAATDFNLHSSRSHAVTKISLEGTNRETGLTLSGSIYLVDLAGSESAKTSSSERLTETKNINKSLSTLGNVMLALYNKEQHVPYRNSKLTFLLQSSLGGNSKTLMFVNIAPFEECYAETVNSLRFAAKVKEVKITSKRIRGFNKIA